MKKPESADPFEQAFFDFLLGDTGAELIVHNNKGDDEIMPVSYFFRSYNEMPGLEQLALQSCAGHTLDIGAGAGCHSLYLQSQGIAVTALDIRPGFVEVMKRRGVVDVLQADIRTYTEKKYDTLLMLMNGIGFVKNLDGLEGFLRAARELLNPGGQIILDSSDLLYLYQDDDGAVQLNLNDGYYGEVEYQVEYNGRMGIPFNWVFIDFSNLAYAADAAGFSAELLFEDDHHNYLARLY